MSDTVTQWAEPAPRVKHFQELAFGMFVHWGLYSLLERGEWVRYQEDIPWQDYVQLQHRFTATDYDPDAWAQLARNAGMRYVCLTTRHHDGFSLYDTCGLNRYDAPHSPAGRDLVAEFVAACRRYDLAPFLYHTTLDHYQDSFENDFDSYLDYLYQSVELLCTRYGPIGGLWFDGNWSKPDADWREDELYGMIRQHQPEAIIVNNSGMFQRGKVGHPELDVVTFEQGRPESLERRGTTKYLAAEMCQTMNQHWGIARQDFCYLSPRDIIVNLCACRRVGANYLLNVGPTATGVVPAYESATLRQVGRWLTSNGDVLYRGRPCGTCSAQGDFMLRLDDNRYLFVHDLAVQGDAHVVVDRRKAQSRRFEEWACRPQSVTWLDNGQPVEHDYDEANGWLTLWPDGYPYGQHLVVRIAKVQGG